MGDNKLAEEQDKSLQTLISYISNVKKINNQEKFNQNNASINYSKILHLILLIL